MKLCNDTITVFNERWDARMGDNTYEATVIDGASWYGSDAETVDPKGGLISANKIIVRIPMTARVADGKRYIDAMQYAKPLPIVDTFKADELPVGFDFGLFTLTGGTIIVKGVAAGDSWTPAKIHKTFADSMTVLSVTDNRRAPNAPHFKVVGT